MWACPPQHEGRLYWVSPLCSPYQSQGRAPSRVLRHLCSQVGFGQRSSAVPSVLLGRSCGPSLCLSEASELTRKGEDGLCFCSGWVWHSCDSNNPQSSHRVQGSPWGTRGHIKNSQLHLCLQAQKMGWGRGGEQHLVGPQAKVPTELSFI